MRHTDLRSYNSHAPQQAQEEEKKGKKSKFCCLIFAILFVILGLIIFNGGFKSLLGSVSIVADFVSPSSLKETDGRTNILLLGEDKRSGQTSRGLTDTVILISVDKDGKRPVLISLPRDLWVNTKSGDQAKINEIYPLYGKETIVGVVEQVLGIPVHYHAIVDFNAFKKVIEIVDGVEINVETAFDDYSYPIEGRENAEPESSRYKHLHFDAGLQKMNAEQALEYARSRKGTNGEGTDFARAKRQQNVILAVRQKVLSVETLTNPSKVKEFYNTYKDYVQTDVGVTEAQGFASIAPKVDTSGIRTVVIDDRSSEDDGGLLYAPEDTTLYRGSYVLIPKRGNGDYSQINTLVSKLLFGE